MVQLTETAVVIVKEILGSQEPKPAGLRIAVVGGGCSGFSYSMAFENQQNMLDKTYKYDGLNVFVDQASLLYLDGVEVDYVETLEGARYAAPIVKSSAGSLRIGFGSVCNSACAPASEMCVPSSVWR